MKDNSDDDNDLKVYAYMARMSNMPRQSAHIVDFLTILLIFFSKRSENKKRNLVLLVLRQTKIQIVQLGNALDADPNIILLQNVPSHLKTENRKTRK